MTAKLISKSENLRTGGVTFELELGKERTHIRMSAIKLIGDSNIMQQLAIEDQRKVAYWAGVEDAKSQAAQYQMFKQLLSCLQVQKKTPIKHRR
jgi:hypothetical protein